MYDAGAAAVLLTGRVDRAPFEAYGRLVETARSVKEHAIVLGAKVSTSGFDRFMERVTGTKDATREAAASIDKSMGGISASTTRMAGAVDRDMKVVRGVNDRAAKSFLGVGDSAKGMANSVVDEQGRVVRSSRVMAGEMKATSDEIIRSNERIAASSAGGGGRGGRTAVAGGMAGAADEAKRANTEWKKGAATLAGLGKWATVAALGIGAVTVKWAADFQRQMELVHTQAGYSQKDVQGLTKAVLNLSPAVGIGPKQLAEGLFHIASSSIPASKAMGVLKIAAEGAKVGNANLEDVTNALVAILRTAPKDIHSTAEAMGVMNDIVGQGNLRMQDLTAALTTSILPAAKAVGLSMRDVGAALDVMTARGVPAEAGATRLRTALSLVANPTSKAQKALDELGFSQDRLARDFREHGLVFALQDLHDAMGKVFGHHLDTQQEAAALTAYATQLKATGASAGTIKKDLIAYKHQLDETGSGAIKATQLIASAFGGARMGTTMQILMQNIDDVRAHVNKLNTDNAAGRFSNAWEATKKDFSVQASQLWDAIQVLGIRIGDWLIPKLKDFVKWLIEAGNWLGKHKVLAEALAVVFGTLLTGAVVAFFTKLILRSAQGVIAIGKVGQAIFNLPSAVDRATAKIVANLDRQKQGLVEVQDQAVATRDALTGEGEAVAGTGGGVARGGGAGGGVLGEMSGAIEGMITGVHGVMAPGSMENPLAVVVMASQAYGLGARGAAAEAQTVSGEASAIERSQGGVILPPGVRDTRAVRGAAGTAAADLAATDVVATAAPQVAETSMLAGLLSKGGGALSALMRGAGVAGMGIMGAQMAGNMVGGKTGSWISTLGSTAAGGAGLGTMVAPGWGTAIGGALGLAAGVAIKLFGNSTPSYGQQIADHMTKGFGGAAANTLKKGIASSLDEANKLSIQQDLSRQGPRSGPFGRGGQHTTSPLTPEEVKKMHDDYRKAGNMAAQQLEAGWNQYKFQDEPTMFKQLRGEIKNFPIQAKAYAIESAIHFASGLESQGRLTKGSADKMLAQAQVAFPGFEKYLGLQGVKSSKTFAAAFNLQIVEKNTRKTLNDIANDFPTVEAALAQTQGTTEDKSIAMVKSLKDIIAHGTGPMKKQAKADLIELQQSMVKYMSASASEVELKTGELRDAIAKGSAQAAVKAGQNFQAFVSSIKDAMKAGVLTVQEGTKLINQATITELRQLGVDAGTAKKLAQQGFSVGQVASSIAGAGASGFGTVKTSEGQTITIAATGGRLPGTEFGLNDVMTLVDPTGRPRAKMAGDESIFNRHQMPYVEAGLQMIGFGGAEDLWNRVNIPHGFAAGGNVSSAFKQPRSMTVSSPPRSNNYIYPFVPNTRLGRQDMGIDANMAPGSPIGPVGDARVEGVTPGWYAGQPYIWWQLLNGPAAGRHLYVAEQITNLAPVGSIVRANQAIATYAGSGTGIEYGWGSPTWQTAAQAAGMSWEANPAPGQPTPHGTSILRFLEGLSGGKISLSALGGLGAGPVWKNIKTPTVKGTGVVAGMAQRVLDILTRAANQVGNTAAGSASVGNLSGPVEHQIYQAFTRLGYNKIANAGIIGNAYQESGLHPAISGGGAAGLFQWTPPTGLLNFAAQHHMPWTDVGVQAELVNQTLGTTGRATMNSQSSPAAAATWFMNNFERPLASAANLPNRINAAQQAYSQGYARGGRLPGFQRGGRSRNPWAPLPSGVSHLPGFRPPRLRRGASGLHVVGSGRHGSSSTGRSSSRRARGSTHVHRPHQSLSSTTAKILDSLGFGNFVDDQNKLGKLDTLYSDQENLFTLFDGTSSAGLPLADLDTLMGIREQQWDILYHEWKTLPIAIKHMQHMIAHTQGHPRIAGHFQYRPGHMPEQGRRLPHREQGQQAPMQGRSGGDVWVPTKGPTHIYALEAQLTADDKELTQLQRDLVLEGRKSTTYRHYVSTAAMAVADQYAGDLSTYLVDERTIHERRSSLSVQRQHLQDELTALSGGTTRSTANETIQQIVDQVMSGDTGSTTSSNPTAAARRLIHEQINHLRAQDSTLSEASWQLSQRRHDLLVNKENDLRKLRDASAGAAWVIQLAKWGVQDKITKLKASIVKLKATLKAEEQKLKNQQSALSTLQSWMTGGLQGGDSILESLGAMGQDILGLYQEGADLPTPGRKEPTLKTIEDVFKAMGLTIPPGLVGGVQTASQAYTDFTNFQGSRQALFAQFGSNFVGAGQSPFATPAGVGAGVQYYGAAAGPSAGLGTLGAPAMAGGGWLGSPSYSSPGPGGTTVNIENHFAAGPPDPHTWSSGVGYEMRAMV